MNNKFKYTLDAADRADMERWKREHRRLLDVSNAIDTPTPKWWRELMLICACAAAIWVIIAAITWGIGANFGWW